MIALRRALWNPIIDKELRSRMRSWRAPVLITLYLALLGGIGYGTYSLITRSYAQSATGTANLGPQLGIQIFWVLTGFGLLLVAFITPALTAGAITGERERQTLDLLLCTRVRSSAIILGKLLASLLFVLLLLVISVPLFSVVFLLGGIDLDQVLSVFVIGVVTALVLGSFGLLCSTIARRSTAATVASYGCAFLLLFGTLIVGVFFPTEYQPGSLEQPAPPIYVLASPITALATSLPQGPGTVAFFPTVTPFVRTATAKVELRSGVREPTNISQPVFRSPDVVPSGLFKGWRVWQAFSVINLLLVVVSLGAGILLLRGRPLVPQVASRAPRVAT